MGNFFEKMWASIQSKAVELIWLVFTSLVAIILPETIRHQIYSKVNDLFGVVPLPVYAFLLFAVFLAYVVHVVRLKTRVKELQAKIQILEQAGARKLDHLNMFGLRWNVDYAKKFVSDPFCPSCQSALTRFMNDTFVDSNKYAGTKTTFMYCNTCERHRRDQYWPTDEDGRPMTLQEAKEKIKGGI